MITGLLYILPVLYNIIYMHMLFFLNIKISEFWKPLMPKVWHMELRTTFLDSGINSCMKILKKKNIVEIFKSNIVPF